jgi:hypothetical protein
MDGALKKGVGLLVILFLGFWLVQDPNGFAESAKDAVAGIWSLLERLFAAVLSFVDTMSS